MKPFINLAALTDFQALENGNFRERYANISSKIGAKKLSYSIIVVEPGFKSCPFHNHHASEEMFLILEGEGTLRFGEKTYQVKSNDIIACPPGNQRVAHQLINTGNVPLKYLALGTEEAIDVCEYPDSGKMQTMVNQPAEQILRHMSKLDDEIDYFEDEA